jgi:hypothetical protein
MRLGTLLRNEKGLAETDNPQQQHPLLSQGYARPRQGAGLF